MAVGQAPAERMARVPKDPGPRKVCPAPGMGRANERLDPEVSRQRPGKKVPSAGSGPGPLTEAPGRGAMWEREGPKPSKVGPKAKNRPLGHGPIPMRTA